MGENVWKDESCMAVRNECHDLGIHVVADCFDGQWSILTTHSIAW